MLIWVSDQMEGNRRILRFVHNGLALSVSMGDGSYSDSARTWEGGAWRNTTFEAALFHVDANGHDIGKDWIKLTSYDDVAGHLPMALLPKLLSILYSDSTWDRAPRIVEAIRTGG